MINNQCSFYGIKLGIKPGDKVHCVLCDEVLIAINRNGRAWINKHDRKTHMKVYHYKHCTKGDNSVRGQHDAP